MHWLSLKHVEALADASESADAGNSCILGTLTVTESYQVTAMFSNCNWNLVTLMTPSNLMELRVTQWGKVTFDCRMSHRKWREGKQQPS